MKNKSKLLIIRKIVNNRFSTSKKELLQYLKDEDVKIELRTLERHLKELKESFFIDYSYEKKGYVKNELIDEDELHFFMHLLNVEMMSQLAMKSIHKNNVSKNVILHSSDSSFKGVEHIQTILEAIENNKLLTFTYNKQHTEISTRKVIPQLLKEYQKRWYLIALDTAKNEELRTFGLDRVSDLKVGKKLKFKRDSNALTVFDNIIGIDTRPAHKDYKTPVKVIFKAIEIQPYYFKSLPLHKSQKIVEEKSEYTIFSVEVMVNYEFKQHIYMYTPYVQILEPKWLAKLIKSDLLQTVNYYNVK